MTELNQKVILSYYSQVSRAYNISKSLFIALLLGWLVLTYTSIAQEQLLNFETKLIIGTTLFAVTAYISLRIMNYGYIIYRIENSVGLMRYIERMGTNPPWLYRMSKRRKSLSYLSATELVGALMVCAFYLIIIWYTFHDWYILLHVSIALCAFALLASNESFEGRLPTKMTQGKGNKRNSP